MPAALSRSQVVSLLLLAFPILLAACPTVSADPPPPASSPAPAEPRVARPHYREIPRGAIGSDAVTIRAEDGSFVLSSKDVSWPSPFQADCWCDEMGSAWPPETGLIEAYRIALRHGGRLVRVAVPDRTQPLYGVFMLCPATETAYGPASRTYRIVVSPEYAAKATAGLMSVVYELMPYRPSDKPANPTKDPRWYSWILWLSEDPVPAP